MNGRHGRWLLLLAVLFLMLPAASGQAREEKKIGVLLFSEEPRYHQALKGIREQLARAGFKEPAVRYIIGNAKGNKAKAAELVHGFATSNLSLMVTLGTNATIAAAKEIKDVPIVFSMVFDPIEARVARDWKRSGTNATGSSPRIPMSELLARLQEFRPSRRLAVLYTPGERNSESQLKDLQELQERYRIRVMPVIVTNKEDIGRILPDVLTSVDSVYLSGSSIVGDSVPQIVQLANQSQAVTITHLEDLVNLGVLLGVCPDPYQLGLLAGKKAAAVLKGADPSSIPIEYLSNPGVLLNSRTAADGRFQVPAAFMKKVTKTIR
jgi:putative ABC transport system substrate-binding protein